MLLLFSYLAQTYMSLTSYLERSHPQGVLAGISQTKRGDFVPALVGLVQMLGLLVSSQGLQIPQAVLVETGYKKPFWKVFVSCND